MNFSTDRLISQQVVLDAWYLEFKEENGHDATPVQLLWWLTEKETNKINSILK